MRGPVFFPVRAAATAYVDVFRGLPLLIVILLCGFGIPALELSGLPSDPIILGGIALTLSYSAYVAEVYRAGIGSIHRGQRDAALAIGLTEGQAVRICLASAGIWWGGFTIVSVSLLRNRRPLAVADGGAPGSVTAGFRQLRHTLRDLRRLLAGEAVGFGETSTRLRNRSARPWSPAGRSQRPSNAAPRTGRVARAIAAAATPEAIWRQPNR